MEELLGVVLRLSISYVYLLTVLRLAGKRTVGEGTPFDFLIALIIGDMSDDVIWGIASVAQGLVAMGTLMLLHLVAASASYHSIAIDRLLGSGPAPFVKNGELVRETMAGQRLNEGDVDVLLRDQSIDDRGEVGVASLEPNGKPSVQRREWAKPAEKRDRRLLEEVVA